MSRTNLLLALAMAASLLTACTSGDDSTTSSATPSTTAVAPSPGTGASGSGASGTDTGGSGGVPQLDEATTSWFGMLCGDLTDLQSSSEAIGASISAGTGTPAEQQATIAAAVGQIATTFKDSAASLSAAPAPTISQGATLAAGAIAALDGVGDALTAAGQTFAAVDVSDQASLSAASQALSSSLQTSFGQIGTSLAGQQSAVSPDVEAAIAAIPGCDVLGG